MRMSGSSIKSIVFMTVVRIGRCRECAPENKKSIMFVVNSRSNFWHAGQNLGAVVIFAGAMQSTVVDVAEMELGWPSHGIHAQISRAHGTKSGRRAARTKLNIEVICFWESGIVPPRIPSLFRNFSSMHLFRNRSQALEIS